MEFAAASWLACIWLWLNEGRQATATAVGLLKGFRDGKWEGAQPQTDEEAVDAWQSAAQVFILNSHTDTISVVVATADAALERAKRSGDVVRTARVAALKCLALAETNEDVPVILEKYEEEFDEAVRVGDGFALGMRALAHGRWLVGVGGIELARTTDSATVAQRSLRLLTEAVTCFRNQGMDPWELFAFVQLTKAHADLLQFDNAQGYVNSAVGGLKRFPILASHVYEALGQIQTMLGSADAPSSFQAALEAAEESGLLARRETLVRYLSQTA
jgi:hypothetical protein